MLQLLRRNSVARRMFISSCISVWGDVFYAMAAMWTMLQLTGSAWQMALVAVGEVVPYLIFGPLGGALADRWDRRRMAIVAAVVQGVVVGVVPLLYVTGLFSPWLLPVVGFLIATCRTVSAPAMMGYRAGVIPPEDRTAMQSLQTLAFRSGSVVAPLLIGLFFSRLEIVPAFLVDSATFFIAAVITATLPPAKRVEPPVQQPEVSTTGAKEKRNLLADVAQGWRILRAHPLLLLGMLSCTLGSVVRAPIYRFALPLLATGSLAMGESGYKLLQISQGVGGLVGALFMHTLLKRSKLYIRSTLGAWVVCGLGTMLLGVGPLLLGPAGLVPAIIGLALSSAAPPLAYGATNVSLQDDVADQHVGKVSGLYTMLDYAGDYGGVLIMPLLKTWISTEAVFALGGGLLVLVCGVGFLRSLRHAPAPAGAAVAPAAD